jgi:hypothetical protein
MRELCRYGLMIYPGFRQVHVVTGREQKRLRLEMPMQIDRWEIDNICHFPLYSGRQWISSF